MTTIFVNILAFATLLSSVFSITSKNPVISVIFLISTFVSGAGYLILIGINFVGISYIIVYVGAIAVLFLFVIMMINIKLTDILETGSQYTKNLPLAIAIGSLFIFIIFSIIPFNFNNVPAISIFLDKITYLNTLLTGSSQVANSNNLLSTVTSTIFTSQSSDVIITDFQQIESLGYSLYTYGAVLLITLSVILLLAMFATIVISKTNNEINVHQSYTPNIAADLTKSTALPSLINFSFSKKSSQLTAAANVKVAALTDALNTVKTATASFFRSIKATTLTSLFTVILLLSSFTASLWLVFKYFINLDGYFVFSFITTGLFYYYVVDKFNYSQNKYIAFSQKVIFNTILYFIIAYFIIFAGTVLEIFSIVECSSGENDVFISKFVEDSGSYNQAATGNESSSTQHQEGGAPSSTVSGLANASVADNSASQKQDIINVQTESAQYGSSKTTVNKDDQVIIKVNKKALDLAVKTTVEVTKEILDKSLPNLAIASIASTAVAAIVKATPNLPPVARVLTAAATAGTVTATSTIGLGVGKSIVKNAGLSIDVKNSKHSNPDLDQIPSPDDDMIRAPLENGDLISPLEELLTAQLILNGLSLFLIFIIIYIIFSIFIYKKNINLALAINKFLPLPVKFKEKFINLLEKGANLNTKFMLAMLILCIINLIVIILINIFISVELTYKTEDYITVYNYLKDQKDSASFLIFTLTLTSHSRRL